MKNCPDCEYEMMVDDYGFFCDRCGHRERREMQKDKVEISCVMKLFDDESTRKKFEMMDKFEIMNDDERNPIVDYTEMDYFLQFGKTYKFTLSVEEVKE